MKSSPSRTPHGESPMGTPGNGFRKPYIPSKPLRPEMTVREAVAKYGDMWRLFLGDKNPHRHGYQESITQDHLEAIDMLHMERGLKSRVET